MNNWVNCRIFGFEAPGYYADSQNEWVAGKSVLKKTRSRIMVLIFGFGLAYLAIIGRMTDLTVTNHVTVIEEANGTGKDISQSIVANIKRADVLDRNGNIIATSLKTQSLYADPKIIFDANDATRKLMTVFPDLQYEDTFKKLSSKRRFVWLKRNLTPKQIYAANALGLPGIEFLDETRRVYPYGNLMSHVMGYVDVDSNGLSGLERGMDKALRNDNEPMQTTLDVRLQYILSREIKKSIDDFGAIGGAGLIMDAKNGEIYALTSIPDFNPHDPGNISDAQRFDRITLGAYEMGSTFKTFTMAAAIEFAHMPLTTTFNVAKPLYRSGFYIHDFEFEKAVMTIPEIFMYSSNIGTAQVAERIGTPVMKKFFGDLGLLDKPSLEIKEVAQPLVPNPWSNLSTLTASYGHGIAVTPLNLASAYAAMVNGGLKVHPTLIKHDESSYAAQPQERVISEKTSATIRELLRIVVTDGTGKKANAKGYLVAGKTGTAEKTMGNGYNKHAQIASFVSAFPIDNPRFIVMLMVDEPHGNKKSYGFATAGWVAAPYVGNVIKEIAPLEGIAQRHDDFTAGTKAALGLTGPLPSDEQPVSKPTTSPTEATSQNTTNNTL
jgi:cell division protein FtsI (penicillin-binding protein 3)